MPQTKEGARIATDKLILEYGRDENGKSIFHMRVGGKGGKATGPKGFASEFKGKDGLTGRQRAVISGRKGGYISRRRKANNG